jgi:tight adherence protein B
VFTSYIVPLLGVGALVMLNAINSRTLPRMTSSPIGISVLIVAATLFILGSLAIRRVTRIEV